MFEQLFHVWKQLRKRSDDILYVMDGQRGAKVKVNRSKTIEIDNDTWRKLWLWPTLDGKFLRPRWMRNVKITNLLIRRVHSYFLRRMNDEMELKSWYTMKQDLKSHHWSKSDHFHWSCTSLRIFAVINNFVLLWGEYWSLSWKIPIV